MPGALVLRDLLPTISSLTECNVRNNNFDVESAKLLSKVSIEKRIMLFGIKHSQEEADFNYEKLYLQVDAILIASDLAVTGSLTSLNLRGNNFGNEGSRVIAEALRINSSLTSLDIGFNEFGTDVALEFVSIFEKKQMTSVPVLCQCQCLHCQCPYRVSSGVSSGGYLAEAEPEETD